MTDWIFRSVIKWTLGRSGIPRPQTQLPQNDEQPWCESRWLPFRDLRWIPLAHVSYVSPLPLILFLLILFSLKEVPKIVECSLNSVSGWVPFLLHKKWNVLSCLSFPSYYHFKVVSTTPEKSSRTILRMGIQGYPFPSNWCPRSFSIPGYTLRDLRVTTGISVCVSRRTFVYVGSPTPRTTEGLSPVVEDIS